MVHLIPAEMVHFWNGEHFLNFSRKSIALRLRQPVICKANLNSSTEEFRLMEYNVWLIELGLNYVDEIFFLNLVCCQYI